MKKKILSIAISAIFILSLVSCTNAPVSNSSLTVTETLQETVEKVVTLTIEGSVGALPFVIGGVSLAGLGTASFFVIKKKKK